MGPCAVAIPIATAVASAGLQMAANQQARSAMERKVRQELFRQQGHQKQASSAYEESAKKSTRETADQQIGEGAGSRKGAYEQAQSLPLSVSETPGVAGTPQQNLGQQVRVQASNTSRAANAGYEDWLLQQMIKNMQAGQQIGVSSNLARGSQAVLPYELQSAQHAGDNLAGIGQLIGLAGSMYGMGSMMRAPAAGASAGAGAGGICGG